MPGPTQTLSPNGENNNDIIQDNGTIIPFRKHTVRGERSYRYGLARRGRGRGGDLGAEAARYVTERSGPCPPGRPAAGAGAAAIPAVRGRVSCGGCVEASRPQLESIS